MPKGLFGSLSSDRKPVLEELGWSSEVSEKSLKESFKETVEWARRKTPEVLGDILHPGLGKLVHLFFIIHECLQDLVALGNPDVPRTLTVPAAEAGGIGISFEVAVPCKGSSAKESSPHVIAVIAPEDSSPLGGWDLKTADADNHIDHQPGETPAGRTKKRGIGGRSLKARKVVLDAPDLVPESSAPPAANLEQPPIRAAVPADFDFLPSPDDCDGAMSLLFEMVRRRREWLPEGGSSGPLSGILVIDPKTSSRIRIRLANEEFASAAVCRIEIRVDSTEVGVYPATDMTASTVEGRPPSSSGVDSSHPL